MCKTQLRVSDVTMHSSGQLHTRTQVYTTSNAEADVCMYAADECTL
jgi:hypothetical protein